MAFLAELIFVTNITNYIRGEKICHVEKFQLSILNLNNLWSFIEIYAVFVLNLCEEKFAWRKSLWKKMTNMRSGLSSIHTTTSSTTTTQEEAVAQIEGLSRRIRSTARIFSSTTNQPTNCVELVGARIILSAPRSNLAKSARPDYQQCQRNLIFDNNRPKQMLL